jgi:hypothetical protein
LGRANPAGFQVLYLADRRDTAFSEKGIKNDDVILAEFAILPDQAIHIAPIGERAMIQRTGRGSLCGDASPEIMRIINACDGDAAKSLLITDAFLFRCLTNTANNYELSSTVAMGMFNKLPFLSAVAYPSRRQMGALNFAVRIEDFWSHWGISAVRRGRAVHLAEGYYKFTNVRHVSGITVSGELRWDMANDVEDSVALLQPLWIPSDVS